MRKWKRTETATGIEYTSDKGEKIYRYDEYRRYAPERSAIAYKMQRVKYYCSPQIRHMKFDTLKEIKEYFENKYEL